MRSGSAVTGQFETMAILLIKANYFSYQIGMVIWSLGGLMFCSILYQSKLIPRLMSVWGVVGYIVFISGSILQIFGLDLSLIISAQTPKPRILAALCNRG